MPRAWNEMKESHQSILVDAAVFGLLVGIGVLGRWGQPAWAVTPLAATAMFAGAYFSRPAIAVLVPLLAMFLSDAALLGYDHFGVMLTVYAAMGLPVLVGRWLTLSGGTTQGNARWYGRLVVGSALPATLFFLLTNLAVWFFRSDYSASVEGLLTCYANALPFYRQMLAGDVFYTGVLFGGVAIAGFRFGTAREAMTAG